MAFNIGNGLAAAGAAVAQTAGTMAIESQKAELQKEMVTLADTLATKREYAGREHAGQIQEKLVEKQQVFQGGENEKQRASAKELAMISANTAITTAGISAGATLGAARMQVDARAKEHDLDLKAQAPLREAQIKAYGAETLLKEIQTNGVKLIQDARVDLQKATESGDAAALSAAKLKLYNAEFSNGDEMKNAAAYQAQAKLIETQLSHAQTRLVQLQDASKMMDPAAKALADQLQKQVAELTRDMRAAVKASEAALARATPNYKPPGGATDAAPATLDLNKFMIQQSRPAKPGLLNQTPAPVTGPSTSAFGP